MNVLDLQTRKNVYELIPRLKYGTVFVSFGDEDSHVAMSEYCNLVSALNPNLSMIDMNEATDTVVQGGEYVEKTLDGIYTITWKSRHETPPIFTDQEFSIDKMALQARDNKELICLEIRKELFKYAREIGKFYGIKSILNGFTCVFSGKQKSVSAYKQIEQALINDLDKVEFSSDDFNPQTIRVYASQFSGFGYGKLKVSVKGKTITVMLKEPDPKDIIMEELKSSITKMASFGVTYTELKDRITKSMWEVYGEENSIDENELPEAPNYIKSGFDNESDYLDYLSEQREPQPDIIKEVEGLQQYVMPIITAESNKPPKQDEYDDF